MSAYFETPLGYKLHYISSGNTSGQLAICLHGLGGSSETFAPLLPYLPQSLHVVRVDFPGFGKSPVPAPPKRISVADHVANLHHLVTSLQAAAPAAAETEQQRQRAGPILLLGHSLGGIVSLHYTARYPDTVAGLFLLGPGRAIGHIPPAKKTMLDLAAKVRARGIEAAATNATKTNFYEDTPERAAGPALRQAVHDAVAASDPEGYAQTCEALVDASHVDPDYTKIKCPVIVVAGDKDGICPLQKAQDLAAQVGGSVEVVKSGHQPILEDLDGVKKAFELFLQKTK